VEGLRTILVVEDDRDLRDSIVEILAEHGYRPLPAANGREALDQLRQEREHPSLILLDLMMPVMDGFEFRQEQSADAELAAIPVVLLSAHASVADTAQELSVAAYLKKPVRLEILLEMVARFCGTTAR
jgi:CheY-like chemotaxis protein